MQHRKKMSQRKDSLCIKGTVSQTLSALPYVDFFPLFAKKSNSYKLNGAASESWSQISWLKGVLFSIYAIIALIFSYQRPQYSTASLWGCGSFFFSLWKNAQFSLVQTECIWGLCRFTSFSETKLGLPFQKAPHTRSSFSAC